MDEIEQLIAAYAAALPVKLADVRASIDATSKALAEGKTPDWDALVHCTHKLAGSSGTYGFMHLSAVLRHVEEAAANGALKEVAPLDAREHLARCWQVLDVQGTRASRRGVTQEDPPLVVAPLESHLAAIRKQKAAA